MMEPQDELDKMLFEFFDNTKDNIPISTQNTINNALYSNRKKFIIFDKFKKIAIIILSLLIASSGIVLAINVIKNIKNNYIISTNALDIAMENEENNRIDMDFVYDNNIGIKINTIYLDKTNLNIEYEYNLKNTKNISDIYIKDYIIKNEYGDIIYYNLSDDTTFNNTIVKDLYRNNILENGIYKETVLYTSLKFPDISNLFFEITKISVNNNDISGMWLLKANLNNGQSSKELSKYIATYDKHIKTISTNLDKSSLIIDIELNEKINSDILIKLDSIILTDKTGKEYNYTIMKDDIKNNKIFLKYDVGSFEKINLLNLHIKFNKDKIIDIKLIK